MERPVFKLKHVGINTDSKETSKQITDVFTEIFGFEPRETPISYFAGSGVEVMNSSERGKYGHIAFAVESIPDALEYFESVGWNTIPGSELVVNGKIKLVYLDKEIGGFAIHLVEE